VAIWHSILDVFEGALDALQGVFANVAGVHAWGWAIIALTLIVRLLLLPLAIKQIRSMRAMQAIQPKVKEIQKKHKVDRELMRKDPEQYKAKRQKMNEEMMALYQAEGVNPAASCLPLLAQAPVFFALFSVLRGDRAAELANAPFYFFTSFISDDSPAQGLGALVSAANWPGWLLIVFMSLTLFISQKQTMARQAATGADNPMAQQQKILLYVLPVFLGVISFSLPLGVLLYWVTTNLWQAIQQWFMLREVEHEVEEGTLASKPGGQAAAKFGRKKNGKNGKGGLFKRGDATTDGASGNGATPGKGGATTGKGGATSGKGGATSGKGGATSGKGGASSGKGGATSGDGGATSDEPGSGSGEGPAGSGKDRAPGSKRNGERRPGGPSGPANGPSDAAAPRNAKRDHLPRRGDRR
jgi:YidC/Oxa1 family membrane protein insertase